MVGDPATPANSYIKMALISLNSYSGMSWRHRSAQRYFYLFIGMALNVIMPSGCLGEKISHILIYQGRSHCLDLVLKQSSPASHEDSGSYIIILHIDY